jgi:hypothetical protein
LGGRKAQEGPAAQGPHAADPLRRDAGDHPGRRIGHRRELHARADVRLRELLQELWGAALGDSCLPVDDEVVLHPDRVLARRLDRERHARVALDVLHLLEAAEVRADDLVALEPDPDAGHLRAPVRIQRHQVGEPVRLEHLARAVREDCHPPEASAFPRGDLAWQGTRLGHPRIASTFSRLI